MTSTNPYAPGMFTYIYLAKIDGFIFHIHGDILNWGHDSPQKSGPVDQALTFSQQIVAGDSWGQAGRTRCEVGGEMGRGGRFFWSTEPTKTRGLREHWNLRV